MLDLIKKGAKEFVSSPPLVVGVIIAALETATDQSWEGYATAVVVALIRQVVRPVHDVR